MSPQFPSSRPRTPPSGAIRFQETPTFRSGNNPPPRSWPRWQKALLCSAIWLLLVIGAGLVHVNVILAGKLTPAQEEALSGRYGMLCGAGPVFICAIIFSRRQSRK